jgi:hypothetical protein
MSEEAKKVFMLITFFLGQLHPHYHSLTSLTMKTTKTKDVHYP